MEEKAKGPRGFSDLDKWLVDEEVVNPFESDHEGHDVYTHPYETNRAKGYVRYIIEGKKMIVLNCVIVEKKE